MGFRRDVDALLQEGALSLIKPGRCGARPSCNNNWRDGECFNDAQRDCDMTPSGVMSGAEAGTIGSVG
jgi:hypothetical protein